MSPPSPLDNAATADFAWRRWKRLMRLVALTGLAAAAIADGWLWWAVRPASVHFYIAIALGVFASVLLAGALMSLMFLSAGTGHDAAVVDPTASEWD